MTDTRPTAPTDPDHLDALLAVLPLTRQPNTGVILDANGEWFASTGYDRTGAERIVAAVNALPPLVQAARERDTAHAALDRVRELVDDPGDPNARMNAYYYGFERTGVGIVDAILSAVAQAGKSYHGTDMWADEDEWTTPSHEARIQAAADAAADRIRRALDGGQP